MKKILAAVLLTTCSFTAFAQENSQWEHFMDNGNLSWSFKKGSLSIMTNNENKPFWTVMFRTVEKTTNKVEFVKVAVSFDACKAEQGMIALLDVNNIKQTEVSFVFGGETLASLIAMAECGAGNKVLEKMKKENSSEEAPKNT